MNKPLIFSGSASADLTKSICKIIDVPMGKLDIGTYSDGEISSQIVSNAHGTTYVCQSITSLDSKSVNDILIETLLIIRALKREGASHVSVIAPYLGYARQDKGEKWGGAIGAKLVADLLEDAGADSIFTLDIHSKQSQGFFNHAVSKDFYALPILRDDIKERFAPKGVVIVSPDTGGASRASVLATQLDLPDIAIVRKHRPKPNVSKVLDIIGSVDGYFAILIDDMADTLGTLCNASVALKEKGAVEVHAYATHGVLSGEAIHRLDHTPELESLTITDTIPFPNKPSQKIRILSIANMLAEIIDAHFYKKSFADLPALK